MASTGNPPAARPGRPQWPAVNDISFNDLLEAVAAGIADFRSAPGHSLGIAAIYAVGGWILVLLLLFFDLPFLVYPLAAGFALVAPFIAAGFYAISACLEAERPPSWGAILAMVRDAVRRDLGWMALITGFSLFIWMDIAALLMFGFLGFSALGAPELLSQILTTPMGLLFLFIGHATGAVIAFAVFSISVISVPMLFDRDTDFVTAMVTSVRSVRANPRTMMVWCGIIAVLTGLSLLSGFVGLFVVLPVLGHASWHLYRRAVVPAEAAPPPVGDMPADGETETRATD